MGEAAHAGARSSIEDSRRAGQPLGVISLKEYLESLAARPPVASRRESRERRACARCDGEVFFLHTRGEAVCAGCGATLKLDQRSRST
jgi:ribosomal protein S27AE